MDRIRKWALLAALFATVVTVAGMATAGTMKKTGEAKFKEHCAICHPDGSNIMNPKKTLSRTDREMHNIRTSADIVKLLRNPGPGMTTFDKKALSDKDAKLIADYVISTFTK